MPSLKSFAAAAALAGAMFALPGTTLAGEYVYYDASQDAPLWLPPAPYPFLDAPPMRFAPNYYLNGPGATSHVEWCIARYRSYDASTNMYLGYDGDFHRCRGPAT